MKIEVNTLKRGNIKIEQNKGNHSNSRKRGTCAVKLDGINRNKHSKLANIEASTLKLS